MNHLTTEQFIKLALDQREQSFFQGSTSATTDEPAENEARFHAQFCGDCQEKMAQWQKLYQRVSTTGNTTLPEVPKDLALRTYQSLKKQIPVTSPRFFSWKISQITRTVLLSAAVIFICFGFFTPKYSEAKTIAAQDSCRAHLKTLFHAVMSYVKTHGEYPPTNRAAFLTTLYKSNILKDPQDFLCPGSHCFGTTHPWLGPEIQENTTYPELLRKDILSAIGYEGRYFPINPDMDSRAIPIIWDKAGNHENGRNILFLDGHIEFISEEKFQKLFCSKFHDYPLYLYD